MAPTRVLYCRAYAGGAGGAEPPPTIAGGGMVPPLALNHTTTEQIATGMVSGKIQMDYG